MERAFEKFVLAHGPQVMQGTANAAIVLGFAGLLSLFGGSIIAAAGIGAWVVTGKSPKGLLKGLGKMLSG